MKASLKRSTGQNTFETQEKTLEVSMERMLTSPHNSHALSCVVCFLQIEIGSLDVVFGGEKLASVSL